MLNGFWPSTTWQLTTPHGKAFVTVATDEMGEVTFIDLLVGKAGNELHPQNSSMCWTVKLALRAGVDPLKIARELQHKRSEKSGAMEAEGRVAGWAPSAPAALGQVLEEIFG